MSKDWSAPFHIGIIDSGTSEFCVYCPTEDDMAGLFDVLKKAGIRNDYLGHYWNEDRPCFRMADIGLIGNQSMEVYDTHDVFLDLPRFTFYGGALHLQDVDTSAISTMSLFGV